MDQETPQEKLAAVLVDASTLVEHAERLLASAEDNISASRGEAALSVKWH